MGGPGYLHSRRQGIESGDNVTDKEDELARLLDRVDRNDVGMRQLGRRARLAQQLVPLPIGAYRRSAFNASNLPRSSSGETGGAGKSSAALVSPSITRPARVAMSDSVLGNRLAIRTSL